MSNTQQYYLKVENNEVISEEGSFFKGTPFTITSGAQTIQVEFTRNADKHVIYRLSENGKALIDIDHPDYVPDTAPESITDLLNPSEDAMVIVAALFKVEVSKGEPYNSALESAKPFSYEIKQNSATF